MGKLVRSITADGSVMACAVNTTDMVARMEQIHKTSAVVTAGLGRLTTAASMMGILLKGQDDSLTLRVEGHGPAGTLMAVANSRGNVKSYVENPVVELPLNEKGKLDVAGAVGSDGILYVIKDLGMKEPYVGQVPLVSGEIAEDITQYYAVSEQTPTVCGLGVLVNPDLTVKAAGGYLVQLLPFADESCIDRLEENLKKMPPVSSMFAEGMEPEKICNMLLEGLEPNLLDQFVTGYECDCSRQRVERALISIGAEELRKMRDEEEKVEVNCQFCDKKYYFSKTDLDILIKNAKK